MFSCSKSSSTGGDNEAPTVEITNPPDNSVFLSGSVILISAEAEDNEGVKEVLFYIDDSFVSLDAEEPYEYEWDTGTTRDSVHTIYARAYDTTDNNANSEEITVTILTIPTPTIADIQNNINDYLGQIVTIEGVVTIGAGITHNTTLQAYIQDESERGLMIFDNELTDDYLTDIERGNKLEVTGTISEYNGKCEVIDFSYQILETGIDISGYTLALTIPQALNYEEYEGTYASLSGTVFSAPVYAGGGYNLTIENPTGDQILVRIWDSTGIDISNLNVGYSVDINGVIGIYDDQSELLPGYAEDISLLSGTVTDIDGNVYMTIIIGDKEWMAENLKVTHYRNGESIPFITDGDVWSQTYTPAYCVYDNNEANADIYGYLYNWHAVDDVRGLAPVGWHVATDAELTELEMALADGQNNNIGSKLAGREDLWNDGELDSDPEFGTSGFNLLPGGYRSWWYPTGNFSGLNERAYIWSSSVHWGYDGESWDRNLYYGDTSVDRQWDYQENGYSVRCVRD